MLVFKNRRHEAWWTGFGSVLIVVPLFFVTIFDSRWWWLLPTLGAAIVINHVVGVSRDSETG